MDKKQKEEQYKLFSKAFHEVVVPILEGLATKEDVNDLKEDVAYVGDRVDRVERKVEKVDDRLDRHSKSIKSNKKKIGRLETHITTS